MNPFAVTKKQKEKSQAKPSKIILNYLIFHL